MAEFKPFEMIMRIEYAGAVVDGNAMQTCCKAKPVSELVRCKDCKHYDGNGFFCSDTMMRAADALEAEDKRIAELEARFPKGGVWKKILQNGDGTSDYQCSACLGIIMDVPDDDEHPLCSFCPNCGARMQTVTDCHTLEEGERKDGERDGK